MSQPPPTADPSDNYNGYLIITFSAISTVSCLWLSCYCLSNYRDSKGGIDVKRLKKKLKC